METSWIRSGTACTEALESVGWFQSSMTGRENLCDCPVPMCFHKNAPFAWGEKRGLPDALTYYMAGEWMGAEACSCRLSARWEKGEGLGEKHLGPLKHRKSVRVGSMACPGLKKRLIKSSEMQAHSAFLSQGWQGRRSITGFPTSDAIIWERPRVQSYGGWTKNTQSPKGCMARLMIRICTFPACECNSCS